MLWRGEVQKWMYNERNGISLDEESIRVIEFKGSGCNF